MGIVGLVIIVMSMVAVGRAEDAEEWRKSLGLGKETVSRLHFYYHESPSAVVKVAQPAITDPSTLFGSLWVVDVPLREGPEPTSMLVGRVQGLSGVASREELGLIMALDFGFTQGKYNGSSLSILGKNRASNRVREAPVVGGTGAFRLARGYAVLTTNTFNSVTGIVIVEYNVTVVH